ncbi:MAG: hypothetical protein AB8C84_01265 [Oligoflexales bacterium]
MNKIIMILLVLYGNRAYCQNFKFQIDENIYNDIFKKTSNKTNRDNHTHDIGAGASLQKSSFKNFPLYSKNFIVNYTHIPDFIYPAVHISKKILTSHYLNINMTPSVGYGLIKQKIIVNNYNHIEFNELLSIQWLPMNLDFFYEIPQLKFFHTQPALQLGIQRLWFHHDGTLDGSHYNQTLWSITYGGQLKTQLSSNIYCSLQMNFIRNIQKSNIHFQQMGFALWTFV